MQFSKRCKLLVTLKSKKATSDRKQIKKHIRFWKKIVGQQKNKNQDELPEWWEEKKNGGRNKELMIWNIYHIVCETR